MILLRRCSQEKGYEGHDTEERRELSKQMESAGVQFQPDPTGS